jgi:hypothetical protein
MLLAGMVWLGSRNREVGIERIARSATEEPLSWLERIDLLYQVAMKSASANTHDYGQTF